MCVCVVFVKRSACVSRNRDPGSKKNAKPPLARKMASLDGFRAILGWRYFLIFVVAFVVVVVGGGGGGGDGVRRIPGMDNQNGVYSSSTRSQRRTHVGIAALDCVPVRKIPTLCAADSTERSPLRQWLIVAPCFVCGPARHAAPSAANVAQGITDA